MNEKIRNDVIDLFEGRDRPFLRNRLEKVA
jgi:hypothetical protein